MYGDTAAMRRRAAPLREQGVDVRSAADRLAARTDGLGWTGRAADALRERARERAAQLRDVAARHDAAAESLERHVLEVDRLKDEIDGVERRVTALVVHGRTRLARVSADPAGLADREDEVLAGFTPPPAGHKDWLAVDLPGL